MASYTELRNLFSDDALKNKVEVACIIAAEGIREEDPNKLNHTNRVLWAKQAFESPGAVREKMLMALLAANNALAAEEITGATDAQIQTKVDEAVDVFADGN